MRSKKVLCLIMVLAMIFSLTGCKVSTSSTPDESDSEGTMTTTTETPTNEVVDDAGITLRIYMGTSGYTDMVNAIVKDYKAETGITIDWEIPADEPYTALKTKFAAGDAPDIFSLAPGDYSTWSERCVDLTNESWVSNVYDSSFEFCTVNDVIYGLPIAIEGSGMVYNKDIFTAAGIDTLPTTYSELVEVCKKLQAAGYQPFGEAWGDWGFLAHLLGIPFTYAGSEASATKINTGEYTFATMPYMDDFYNLFDLTLDYGFGKDSIAYHYDSQIPDFAAGKIAMIKQGTWYGAPLLSVNPDLNLGLMAVPLTDDASQTKLQVNTTGFASISNESDAEHQQAAKDFLNWLCENAQTYLVGMLNVNVPYKLIDTSKLGSLHEDMNTYMAKDMIYENNGSEYWPVGFNASQADILQAYAGGAITKEEANEQLTELWKTMQNQK